MIGMRGSTNREPFAIVVFQNRLKTLGFTGGCETPEKPAYCGKLNFTFRPKMTNHGSNQPSRASDSPSSPDEDDDDLVVAEFATPAAPHRSQPDAATKTDAAPNSDPIIECELVDGTSVDSPPVQTPLETLEQHKSAPAKPETSHAAQIALDTASISRRGGAVAAVLLGLLAIGGSWLTIYSGINALIGLPLSIWAMQSTWRQAALTGMILCVIGGLCSLILSA